ncbi:MAG: zinc-binding dehydrogenase [Candidatus Rokubacteria bacterium]|nr:zinc-binding dehydrogenase [Candidatus Rokubacteria bacterium]
MALRDLTDGEGVDCAIECAGSPEARIETIRCVRTWGQACFVGAGGTVTLDVSQHLPRRQVTLHASWTFATVGQEECARFVARRKIPLGRPLIHRFSLEQAAEAYRLFDTQAMGKGVFLS